MFQTAAILDTANKVCYRAKTTKNSLEKNQGCPFSGDVACISTTIQDGGLQTHFALSILKSRQNYKNSKVVVHK